MAYRYAITRPKISIRFYRTADIDVLLRQPYYRCRISRWDDTGLNLRVHLDLHRHLHLLVGVGVGTPVVLNRVRRGRRKSASPRTSTNATMRGYYYGNVGPPANPLPGSREAFRWRRRTRVAAYRGSEQAGGGTYSVRRKLRLLSVVRGRRLHLRAARTPLAVALVWSDARRRGGDRESPAQPGGLQALGVLA